MVKHEYARRLSRRAFLKGSTLLLAGPAAVAGMPWRRTLLASENSARPTTRIGLLTDLHHAEKDAAGTRYYRETRGKLREAIERFNREPPDFVVELGDVIDAASTVEQELSWLKTIDGDLRKLSCDCHYVLGNHCVATLTKKEFLENSGARDPHYSFDEGPFHFVVLDACFRKDFLPYGRNNSVWNDANLPPDELRWLEKDLAATDRPTVIFVHQRLDDVETGHAVRNAAAARRLFEASGKVLAVFQGHHHVNDLREIKGVQYVTLAAVVEGSGKDNNAYSTLGMFEDGSLLLEGFHQQKSYWKKDTR